MLNPDRCGRTTIQIAACCALSTQFRNFHLSNITCEGAKLAFQIRGLPEMPVRDIVLEHINIKADKAGAITFSDGIVCKDVHVEAADGSLVAIQEPAKVSLASCSGFQK